MMSLAEQGVFIRLLCFAWREGSIPADTNVIRTLYASTTGEKFNLKNVLLMFVEHPEKPGRLISKRLELERQNMEEKSEKARESIGYRWGNERNTNVIRKAYGSYGKRNTKQKQNKKQNIKPHTPYTGFDIFWIDYPKKVGMQSAIKAWNKLCPSYDLRQKILTALKQHKESPEWIKDGGQFIPHAATWLNQQRWKDELKIEVQVPVDPVMAELDRQIEEEDRGKRGDEETGF